MLSATDVLRRGFDNMMANWPLLLIRVAENVLILMLVVAAVVATVVPIIVAAGVQSFDWSDLGDLDDADIVSFARSLLLNHWGKIVWLIGAAVLVFLVAIAIHSFVVAGSARVYVDGERSAPRPVATRKAFNMFSADRWAGGGRRHWWTVFWIYNIAWTIASAIILLPWLAVLIAILLMGQSTATVVTGCLGMIVAFFVTIGVAIVTTVWVEKAIVVSVARNLGASGSLRHGWSEAMSDFGRHLIVAVVLFVVMFGGTGVISAFSALGNVNDSAVFAVVMMPVQIVVSVLHAAFSAAVSGWFLASFAALGEDARR